MEEIQVVRPAVKGQHQLCWAARLARLLPIADLRLREASR